MEIFHIFHHSYEGSDCFKVFYVVAAWPQIKLLSTHPLICDAATQQRTTTLCVRLGTPLDLVHAQCKRQKF